LDFKTMGMKITRLLGMLLILWLFSLSQVMAQQTASQTKSFLSELKSGNTDGLALHFGSFILLNFDNEQKVVSRSQAKLQLAAFFENHPADQVVLYKSGMDDNQEYYIYYYHTKGTKWRVYMLLATQESDKKIIQLDLVKKQE